MRIYHLNCATLCPLSARLTTGEGGLFERGRLVCHCLLVETPAGLVLIDSGIGRHDIERPGRLGPLTRFLMAPAYRDKETAIAQVEQLGFDPRDVRHLVVTHLDLDHAGGLADFPWARVHVHEREKRAAVEQRRGMRRLRYRPHQFAHDVGWQTYSRYGDRWMGFEAVRHLRGLDAEIALVPLLGHSAGHCGVAVARPGGGWLLHAGDAFMDRRQLDGRRPSCPAGLRWMQRLVAEDGELRSRNTERLRELAADSAAAVTVFCSHDPHAFRRLAGPASHTGRTAPRTTPLVVGS